MLTETSWLCFADTAEVLMLRRQLAPSHGADQSAVPGLSRGGWSRPGQAASWLSRLWCRSRRPSSSDIELPERRPQVPLSP